MKIYFWKNNYNSRIIVFLILFLTIAVYPNRVLSQTTKGNQSDRTGTNSLERAWGRALDSLDNIGRLLGRAWDRALDSLDNLVNLIPDLIDKLPIDKILDLLILDLLNNVEQDAQDLKDNLASLLPSENQVNLNALAPTNASAQKLQNSMSSLLKKLNEIPNDNAEVVVAKQNVLNELSKSVVGLEQTNDLIKAINQAVAQSE